MREESPSTIVDVAQVFYANGSYLSRDDAMITLNDIAIHSESSRVHAFFSDEELDRLARETEFTKRPDGKISGRVFFDLIVFNSDKLKEQSLNAALEKLLRKQVLKHVQFEYDLLSGRINDLSLHAFNEQDQKDSLATVERTREGDLIIRDLGYLNLAVLQKLTEQNAFFFGRLSPALNINSSREVGLGQARFLILQMINS